MFDLNPPSPPAHLKETLQNLEELEKYLSETIAYHQAAIAQVETKRRAIAILLGTDTVAQLKDLPQVEKNTEVEIEVEDITQTPLDEATGAEAKVDIAIDASGNSLNNSESRATALGGPQVSDPIVDRSLDQTDWSQKEAGSGELKATAETTQLSLLEPEVQPEGANQSDPAIPVEAILGAEIESSLTTTFPVNYEQSNRLDWTKELDFEQIAPRISTILAKESGIVVQIEIIIGRLFSDLSSVEVTELKPKVRTLLIRGQKEKHWAKVPKAENGWTIDLSLLPESQVENDNYRQSEMGAVAPASDETSDEGERQSGENKSYLGQTLVETIRKALRSKSPEAMNADDICHWIYPNGASDTQWRKLRDSVSSTLSNGVQQGYWERLKTGFYRVAIAPKSHSLQRSEIERSSLACAANHTSEIYGVSTLPPDLAEIISKIKNNPLPLSKIIQKYGGWTKIISAIVRSHPGQPISIQDIVNLIAPKNLTSKQRDRIGKSISGVLRMGVRRSEWEKLSPGVYILNQNSVDLESRSNSDDLITAIEHQIKPAILILEK